MIDSSIPPRAGGQSRQLVVLLHGYGANGADLLGLADPLGEVLPHALFVAPDAPQPCPGLPGGFQWFPVTLDMLREGRLDVVHAAAPPLRARLDALWARTGLGPADTILAGFSQGAMMALNVGLGLPEAPLGIVGFSGALIPPDRFGDEESPRPPVCLVHGDMDEMVPVAHTTDAAERLAAAGYPVSVHLSPGMPHGIGPDGLAFAAQFMAGRVAAERA